jgi:4-hydroxythreonine-4-phosphate dehydrogenase
MSIKTAISESAFGGRPGGERPLVAVSMGDAGGIGPEVTLKAVTRRSVGRACRPVVVGDLAYLRSLARKYAITVSLRKAKDFAGVTGGRVWVYDVTRISGKAPVGSPSAAAGRAAGKALEGAVALAIAGKVQGLVTAPVSKESFALAGYGMVGHTEILARLTRTRNFAMMLINGDLRVVFATTHLPHRKAASALTRSGLAGKIELTAGYLERYMGIANGAIAVACLNPHCGEGGRLGREERDIIEPAVMVARDKGICVEGPFAADSIYRPAFAGRFDAIVAMYHDQGMIPLKLRGHGDVVNITLGIPLVRTSPGHGTAFDIAGTGKASDRSMAGAILECARIIKRLSHVC